MRKFCAWLGAALVLFSMASARAAGPSVLKPYILLILDTSGSMKDPTNSGPPSCTDAQGNTLPDTKLNHARCAINNVTQAYGDIVFGFARFHMTTGVVGGFTGACGTNSGAPTCNLVGQDACTTNSDRIEMLAPLDPTVANTKSSLWADFSCNTCTPSVPAGTGEDPEVFAPSGSTPLQGSIDGANCYWQGLFAKNNGSGCQASGSGSVVVWPSSASGFSPIFNDTATNQSFLGPTNCNPAAACYQLTISTVTESGTTATYTTALAHGLKAGDVVSIAGVGVSGYNGTSLTVVNVTSTTKFTVTRASGLTTPSSGGSVVLTSTASCCTSQCRPYIQIMLTDGDETCGGSAGHCTLNTSHGCAANNDCGHCSVTTSQTCTTDPNCSALSPSGQTCVFTDTCSFSRGTCSVTTTKTCDLDFDCPQSETCTLAPSLFATAAAALHTVVSTGSPAAGKRYRVQTIPIGFGVPTTPYDPIEKLALAGGATPIPGQNAGFYASDEAGLELAFSKILEGAVRSELCNNVDDDCDGQVDEDFKPPLNNSCDDGLKGRCKGTGSYGCTADGTGVQCNITSPGGSPQTTCPGAAATCNANGSETCADGIDDDCDGLVDEGCTTCPNSGAQEICNARDDNCNNQVDEGIPAKACGAFPGASCTPNAGCCGTQVCAATSGCTGNGCYAACNNTWTPTGESCNNIDDDCDGLVDEDLARNCSTITGNGCATAPCPETNNPGSSLDYHCTGLKQACSGPTDTSCPGAVACIQPIPENQCHPGTQNCTSGSFGTCGGEAKPTTEICNGLDDDCDNIIDEDTGGGTCNATCGVGTIVCAGSPVDTGACCQPGSCTAGQHQCGTLYCTATSVTGDATCDGVDDNCNGSIDEFWTCGAFRCQNNIQTECQGLSDTTTCGSSDTCVANPSSPAVACSCTGTNICNGQNKCVGGAVVCQGPPVDPTSCCDCAGTPQNGMCSGGAQCAPGLCQCAFPCSNGEFPCPAGKKCDMSDNLCVPDVCFGVACGANPNNGNAQVCVDNNGQGACVDACSVANCGASLRCYDKTGQCLADDCTSPFPDRQCAANQNCIVDVQTGLGMCVGNPCAGVNCPSDQYCEAGNCIASCATVTCPSGQRCRLGQCEADPCGKPCPFGQTCNATTGNCIQDPCQFVNCPKSEWCNPDSGHCEVDPCVGTACPSDPPGQICKGGTCYPAGAFQPDGGSEVHVTVGGGGCNSGSGGAGSGLVLVLGVLLFRRSRRGGAL